jgi:hypothetical protein
MKGTFKEFNASPMTMAATKPKMHQSIGPEEEAFQDSDCPPDAGAKAHGGGFFNTKFWISHQFAKMKNVETCPRAGGDSNNELISHAVERHHEQ